MSLRRSQPCDCAVAYSNWIRVEISSLPVRLLKSPSGSLSTPSAEQLQRDVWGVTEFRAEDLKSETGSGARVWWPATSVMLTVWMKPFSHVTKKKKSRVEVKICQIPQNQHHLRETCFTLEATPGLVSGGVALGGRCGCVLGGMVPAGPFQGSKLGHLFMWMAPKLVFPQSS